MTDRAWKSILRRYGQEVTLHPAGGGEGISLKAFLQPVLQKSEDQQVPSPLGLRREDRFLYLGPADVPLADGDQVEWQGGHYAVQSAHPVGPETGGHFWALLRPVDEEGTA